MTLLLPEVLPDCWDKGNEVRGKESNEPASIHRSDKQSSQDVEQTSTECEEQLHDSSTCHSA